MEIQTDLQSGAFETSPESLSPNSDPNPEHLTDHDTSDEENRKGVRQMFTTEEDNRLVELVKEHGDKNWRVISKHMPNRTTRQCRERYRNYLSPKVTNGPWTAEEDLLLEQKYIEYGPKWATIAQFFKSRSDVNIKNRWASNRHKATRTAPRTLLESLFIPKRQFFNTLQALLLPQLKKQQQINNLIQQKQIIMQQQQQQQQQKQQQIQQQPQDSDDQINSNNLDSISPFSSLSSNLSLLNSNVNGINSVNLGNAAQFQQQIVSTLHEDEFLQPILSSDDDLIVHVADSSLAPSEEFSSCLDPFDVCQTSFTTEFESFF
ncbi:hypothetical protein TRFO_16403 [Tritrichomonas foetus]|uniref:Myb-like DNA-binding domain containing protein n=1 Tax=Tritrichomonas foetus TaxID=1144522 RepID=A0A1J4KQ57_9EUKA|nr:hypothetical protein TRFO_16403 [Tritrichomonas foetus]|eukprot:OHT13423.1 hypothetical protein TRFO_16403 [Tritrichomonas foetus]